MIVCLHSAQSTSVSFTPIMDSLLNESDQLDFILKDESDNENNGQKSMRKEISLLAIDLRGFAESSFQSEPTSAKDFSADVLQLLEEKFEKVEKCYIFGHEYGATVAVHTALAL